MTYMGFQMIAMIAVAFIFLANLSGATETPVYSWIEAENPSAANFQFDVTQTEKPGLLSKGNWVTKNLSKEEVAVSVPEEGFLLKYELNAPQEGNYELWARIGWEWARAPFEWRIGYGDWQKVEPTVRTTNVMSLGHWMEVAWLHLTTVELPKGLLNLHLRYREPSEDSRLLIGLDCFALVKGHFFPEGRLKPGQQYDSESDRKAANQIFQLPLPQKSAERVEVRLNGLWQVARYDDPDMDRDTFVPVQKLSTPDDYPLRWMEIEVPKSLWDKDETVFAHRVIYRTCVNIPVEHEGRGFYLHFSGTNWIASVFVNGKLAGTHQGVWIPWDLDISKFVEPGQVNEITIAVKGCYYAIDAKHSGNDSNLDQYRNIPRSQPRQIRWFAPIYPSTKGDGNGHDYGIVNTVTLVSAGDIYTENVFIKPSVEKKRLEVDVTIRNTTGQRRELQILCEAVYDRDNIVEYSFAPVDVVAPANDIALVTVTGEWENPKLWWPKPNPHLYRLRTTIFEKGKPIDIQEELFGFREVTIKDAGIYINGVRRNFWNWVGVPGNPFTAEEWLNGFREDKDRFTRFSMNRKTSNFLKTREERLEFYDRNGIPGRLCSMIDGMFISFALGDRRKVGDKTEFIPNERLWENFRRHMEQLTRAYRNHPSVIMYQVENELVYINGMNIYGDHLDKIEELMNDVVEAGRKHDASRPYTVGGAGDLSGRLEINSPHYPLGRLDWYPENAYTLERYANKITHWPWDKSKPWVVGESAYANQLEFGSYVLGDEVFRGTAQAQRGKAKFLRMLYGGYRWAGVAGFFPWDNLHQYEDAQMIFSDLCIIPRKQTHRLFSGQDNELLFEVMNDTFSREPVIVKWKYTAENQEIASDEVTLQIEPGFGKELTLDIPAPQTDKRLEGTLSLKASQSGTEDYVDVRAVPILPVIHSIQVETPLFVLDKSHKLKNFLTQTDVKFTQIQNLTEMRDKQGLLIIGSDTLTATEALGQDILAFAVQGGRVIVLEQEIPVAGANLPAPLTPTTHFGGYAHPQAPGTPLFRELSKGDLIDWAVGHPTYKNVYIKPTQGARSLVECGEMLKYTALAEVPCGEGVIVLCQLRVGANLGVDPAAGILLRNLIETYDDYQPSKGITSVYTPGNNILIRTIQQTGAFVETVQSIENALNLKYKAAIIQATRENLAILNNVTEQAKEFQNAGGWIMLMGLEPDGLEEFNKFLGTNHLIRPCHVERVTLERPDFPLAATLGNRDLSLYSNEWIARWEGKRWISGNVYSFVVDGLDIAPFCQMPGGPENLLEYKPTFDDKDPYNFVNGMLNSDFWRYIRQIWIPKQGAEPLIFALPRPEKIRQINLWNNANYWTIKDLDIIFDGEDKSAVRVELPDSYDLKEVQLPQPRKVQKTITFQIKTWREQRPDRPDIRLAGIDNVQFLRAEIPPKAVVLDNVGGLVAYPHGDGGVFLNQLKFMADEPNKANADKKLRILSVLLQNMGIGSQTTNIAVPGINVKYQPVDITDYCTQYMTEQSNKPGWFGEKDKDLRNLAVGEQILNNVMYHLVDYSTAPVPDCIMLAAEGAPKGLTREVTGIKIDRKADLLFFLHTAKVRYPITERERSRLGAGRRPFVPPEVVRYIIHYVDGTQLDIPVTLREHIQHWEQEEPSPLKGATVATTFLIPNVNNRKGVLYGMQAKNPYPNVDIKSIDVTLIKDEHGRYGHRAIPALLAITLGTVLDKQGK